MKKYLIKFTSSLFLVLSFATCLVSLSYSIEKRDRYSGLFHTSSSSVMGRNNLFLNIYGRTFLWDNNAASNVPTIIPNLELGYGLWDIFQLSGGMQIMTTRPSLAFLKIKMTTPNNKNIRMLGFSQSFEVYKNLSKEFKSNGFRFENQGFTPDHFKHGGTGIVSYYKFVSALDFELIRLTTLLPLKFYLNLGYELPVEQWMDTRKKEAEENYEETYRLSSEQDEYKGSTDFSKVPAMIGMELKTSSTDFFLELEGDFFRSHIEELFKGKKGSEKFWVRYNVVLAGDNLKVFDMHIMENPIFINVGGRLKYPNGLTLSGGFSWLLSRDYGGTFGGCSEKNVCHGDPIPGARDGFSTFYPQWRLFGGLSYPLKFQQTSAELYRTYLLRKNRKNRKVIDIESNLEEKTESKDPLFEKLMSDDAENEK